jgi:hypothetical protein
MRIGPSPLAEGSGPPLPATCGLGRRAIETSPFALQATLLAHSPMQQIPTVQTFCRLMLHAPVRRRAGDEPSVLRARRLEELSKTPPLLGSGRHRSTTADAELRRSDRRMVEI